MVEFDEGYRFNKKFKSFLEQYELREIQFNADMRMKEAEVLVNMAKYEQEKKRADQAEERARGLSAQVATFSQTETELRSQLNIYVEKFKQVGDQYDFFDNKLKGIEDVIRGHVREVRTVRERLNDRELANDRALENVRNFLNRWRA